MKISELTGIRGVGAVWVCIYHMQLTLLPVLFPAFPRGLPVLDQGYVGVDLFLILSGFVLAYGYGEKFLLDSRKTIRAFAIGRVFRILPLHWATLTVAVVMRLWLGDGNSNYDRGPVSLIATYLLVQTLGGISWLGWNGPSWSLSAEWLLYAAFPFVLLLAARIRSAVLSALFSLASLGCMIGVLVWISPHSPTLNFIGRTGILRCACEFFAGILLWNAWRKLSPQQYPALCRMAVPAGLFLLGFSLFVPGMIVGVPFGFLLLIAASASGSRLLHAMLANRLVMFLGEISFSLYLTHNIVTTAAEQFGVKVIAPMGIAWRIGYGILIATAVFLIAYLFWKGVEMPTLRLHNRYKGRNIPKSNSTVLVQNSDIAA